VDGVTVLVETASQNPRIQAFRNLLSEDEADTIIRLALPRMQASPTYRSIKNHISESGSSTSADISPDENNITETVSRRMTALSGYPVSHLETMQVIRYDPGQFLVPHHDYLEPTDREPLMNAIHARGGQRIKSLLVYLNDLQDGETGGSTYFPRLHLCVSCSRGAGIMWDNIQPDRTCDPKTLHAGAAPIISTKFILVSWIRECPVVSAAKPLDALSAASHSVRTFVDPDVQIGSVTSKGSINE
jgi:prolyl 4-hydroxylase